MALSKLAVRRQVPLIRAIMDEPAILQLVGRFEERRSTGRRGFAKRSLVGACIVKHVFNLKLWTETVDLIFDHDQLVEILGDRPSAPAMYRFTKALIKYGSDLTRLSHFLGFGLSDPGVAAFGCVVGARLVGGWLTI